MNPEQQPQVITPTQPSVDPMAPQVVAPVQPVVNPMPVTQVAPVAPQTQLQPQPTMAPAPTPTFAAPAPAQPAGVGTQFPFWYFPGRTTLTAKKGIATFYPGLLVVIDATTNQEVYRLTLTPDIKIKAFLGTSRITFLGGQKPSIFDKKYAFTFYNPKLLFFLSYLFIFMGSSTAKQFTAACKQAAGAPA